MSEQFLTLSMQPATIVDHRAECGRQL